MSTNEALLSEGHLYLYDNGQQTSEGRRLANGMGGSFVLTKYVDDVTGRIGDGEIDAGKADQIDNFIREDITNTISDYKCTKCLKLILGMLGILMAGIVMILIIRGMKHYDSN